MKTFFKLTLLFITINSFAQLEKKFYVGINGGYNLNTTKNLDFAENAKFGSNYTEISTGRYNYSQGEAELGKGFQFNINAGYVFNKYLGTELAIGYFVGGKSEIKGLLLNGQYDKSMNSARGILVKPSLFFHAGLEKINPYLKLGITLGKIKLLYDRETFGVAGDPNTLVESTREFDGGIAFGYQGAFGMTYNVGSGLNLVGELSLNRLVYSPKESHLTTYKVNGEEMVGLIPLRDREFVYVSEVVGPETIDSNQPAKTGKIQADLSSISLNLGVIYNFN